MRLLKEEDTRLLKKFTASIGEPFGALTTQETTVQNPDFFINTKNPECVYGPAYNFSLIRK